MDAPAVALIALTLAAALVLVEVALPTFGVAGVSALALVGLAALAADSKDDPWWPLLFVGLAVFVWAVLLFTRRRSPALQLAASALFAVGGVGYGVLASDILTIVVSVVGAASLPFVFRPLLRATDRLLGAPPQMGMDALIGRTGTVVSWSASAGTVRVDGSLWNATGPGELSPGVSVVVVRYGGMTLEVALHASVP